MQVHAVPFLFLSLPAPALGQVLLQELGATGGVVCEQFGHGLAVDGRRMVVGAAAASEDPKLPCALGPGAAYVLELQEARWVQTHRLAPPDGGEGDEFGNSVAVFGDRIVVGSELHDGAWGLDSGAAYVYELQGETWALTAKLEPSDGAPLQSFARSVAICGDWLVCGTRLDCSLGFYQAGAAYVFRRDASGIWVETQKLFASDPAASALFGNSCSVDGDTLVVGSYFAFGPLGTRDGAAYVFRFDGTSWRQTHKLTPSHAGAPTQFGRSVCLQGERLVVGARTDGGPGTAYVFEWSGSAWAETGRLVPPDGQDQEEFGESVAIRGDHALVGARFHIPETAVEGRAFLYQKQGAQWVELAELRPAHPGQQAFFGYNVALSAWGAAVGAPFDHNILGAVYVFAVPAAAGYCTAGVSASGCRANLSAAGVASASLSDGFTLSASAVEGDKSGLFFFGTSGQQANPWGNGTSFQCVVPPVMRAGLLAATGTPGLCDGSFEQDLNALWCPTCPRPLKNPGAGALVQAQLWYRDPLNTGNRTTSLSDALEFLVEP